MNLNDLEMAYVDSCGEQGIDLAMLIGVQPPQLVWNEIEQLADEKQLAVSLLVGQALLDYVKTERMVSTAPAEESGARQTKHELTLSEPGGLGVDWVELDEGQLAEVREYIGILKGKAMAV